MHEYIQAIGFLGKPSYKEIRKLLLETKIDYRKRSSVPLDCDVDFSEYKRTFGDRIGWLLYGEEEDGVFYDQDYFVPYFSGHSVTSYSDIIVEKRSDRESYYGICEDMKVGVSLIFHLQNVMEYLKRLRDNVAPKAPFSVSLSGLANEGTILFPVVKSVEQEAVSQEASKNRRMLLSAAKQGDSDAIESLALEEMDLYQMVSQRLVTEDVLSIVESYFMPYSVECDRYSILGEIQKVSETKNIFTKESIYILTMDVNEVQFDICVPKRTLIGEPLKGRRFRGNIWLQGRINYLAPQVI